MARIYVCDGPAKVEVREAVYDSVVPVQTRSFKDIGAEGVEIRFNVPSMTEEWVWVRVSDEEARHITRTLEALGYGRPDDSGKYAV